jgi:hypothetical protein
VLLRAALAQLERRGVARQYADGSLPAPGVYGIPAQWPHVEAALLRAGFEHQGRVEIVFLRALGPAARLRVESTQRPADRLIAYATLEEDAALALYAACGLTELTRTKRGWSRSPAAG